MTSTVYTNVAGGYDPKAVLTVTLAQLPVASASNIGVEYDVSDLNGGCRVKSDGVSWIQIAASLASESAPVILATVSRNLAASDNGAMIKVNQAGVITLTLVAGLPARFNCRIMQCGAGKVTVAAVGVGLNAQSAKFSTAAQYAVIEVCQDYTAGNYIVTGQSGL